MNNDTHRVSVVIERSRFPKLASFVEWGVDMQLADVRDMLRPPLAEVGLSGGYNFAATATLVNLIGGASVSFYDASVQGLGDRGIDRGATATRSGAAGRGTTARRSTPRKAHGSSMTTCATRSRTPSGCRSSTTAH